MGNSLTTHPLKASRINGILEAYHLYCVDHPHVPELYRKYTIPGFDKSLYMDVGMYSVTLRSTPHPFIGMATYIQYRMELLIHCPEIIEEQTRKAFQAWFATALLNGLFEEVPNGKN